MAPPEIRHDVLVVDSDPVARELALAALAHAGYVAAGAGTARQALELVAERSFRLVVADVLAPALTDCTFVRWLQDNQRLPLLLAIGPVPDELLDAALALPVRELIGKPYVPAALSAAVGREIAVDVPLI